MHAEMAISTPATMYTMRYPYFSDSDRPIPGASAWGRTWLSAYVATPLDSFSLGREPDAIARQRAAWLP